MLNPTDALSGVAKTYYAYGTVAPSCSPSALAACIIYSAPFQISAEGTYTLVFFSVDKARNPEIAGTKQITIDKIKPVISGSASPPANANGWNHPSDIISCTCAETGPVQSGIQSNTVAGRP